ncbi:hypothetical protein ACFQ1Q_09580 [Winogradskyella litorisediminis]|uniref:Lipoprotein n=1 Tax=Winogradskyella litorisediminis TaxID=1156618 RepID=A0ABW3NAB0_9FLAO
MTFKKIGIFILAFFYISLQSCKDNVKLENILDEKQEQSPSIGTKHFLEEDGIQLQLPDNFKRLSLAKYSEILNSKSNKNKQILARAELQNSRSLNGNSYIFYNKADEETYFVNTIPFSEIEKEDAQKLLGIIRQNNKEVAKKHDVKFTKVTAKFKSITGAQIFKAVFKADFKKTKTVNYQHTYYITSNDKSVLLKLITPTENSFDKYIEKMIF